MKINLKGKFKSLETFESDELSNLTIITGKNGTGKSQLLNAIDRTFKNQTANSEYTLTITPTPKSVQAGEFIYKNTSVSLAHISAKLEKYTNRISSLDQVTKEFYRILYNNNLNFSSFEKLSIDEISLLIKPNDFKDFFSKFLRMSQFSGIDYSEESYTLKRVSQVLKNDEMFLELLLIIKSAKEKEFDLIDKNDFYTVPIPDKFIDSTDLYGSQVEMVFHNYLKRRSENDYRNFRKEKGYESNDSIGDDEFEEKFPAPWSIINRILKQHLIDLEVRQFNLRDYSDKMITDVFFYKKNITEAVTFNSLSSGEQVIISLILKLFTKEYYETTLTFPDLIILDEPDAYLHPEMSKLLIDVLYKSFVQDLGIKVIVTTHSPSTVALSPDGCIYEMKNTPSCSLRSVSKDSALRLLTGMLPMLSIDYKNHKQVFLESPTDVIYFQNIFNKINEENQLRYKLYFISNERGKSNCDWVKEIVNKLKAGGVSKVLGIIDWDGKNSFSEDIYVHGAETRYSIENFLYDAIYLAILFLESNGANNIRKDLSFSETYLQYNLIRENCDRLQEVWNWIILKICKGFPVLKEECDVEITYSNNIVLKVPSWYLKMKGHELELKLKKCFPSLEKYKDEGKLQKDLSIIMAKCYPFIPNESFELIKQIAS